MNEFNKIKIINIDLPFQDKPIWVFHNLQGGLVPAKSLEDDRLLIDRENINPKEINDYISELDKIWMIRQ